MSGFQLPQHLKPKMIYINNNATWKDILLVLSVQESWHDQSDKASANSHAILDYHHIIYIFDIVTIQ